MTPGAFDLPYGSVRESTPEMVKAGVLPSTYVASSTNTATFASATIADVDASGQVVVWGMSVVSPETALQAYELFAGQSAGLKGDTVVVAGATNSGPYFYSFDTPHLCTTGKDLFIRGIAGSGTSYAVVYYSIITSNR